MSELHYKVLGPSQESFHGGTGKWRRRQWRSVRGEIIACAHGIHYCRRDQLIRWLGPTIWLFEDGTPDEAIDAGDKMVTRKGRIVERVETWNETTARLFAADVAELTLVHILEEDRAPFAAAINAARGFARGEVDAEAMSAARSAVDAAWSAADLAADAAVSAARSAAVSAADLAADAARSAARLAARSAAGSAADLAADAAGSAAWSALTKILFDYLEGRRS